MPLIPSDALTGSLAVMFSSALDRWMDDESDLRSEADVILEVLRDPFNRPLVAALLAGDGHDLPAQLSTPVPQTT